MNSPDNLLPISVHHRICSKNRTALNKCIHYARNFKIFLENPEEEQRLNTKETKDGTKGNEVKTST
jgi:hypothetical protein